MKIKDELNKKAQGLPLNVIVLAAIALIVLVVLAVIFLGRAGTFVGSSQDCEQLGNKCLYDCSADPDGRFTKEFSGAKCFENGKPSNKKCCTLGA